jgi:hypothetical protein
LAQPDRDLLLDSAAPSADPQHALAERICAFEDHYRQIAKPFDWSFTRADLDALLARLASRESQLRLAA